MDYDCTLYYLYHKDSSGIFVESNLDYMYVGCLEYKNHIYFDGSYGWESEKDAFSVLLEMQKKYVGHYFEMRLIKKTRKQIGSIKITKDE